MEVKSLPKNVKVMFDAQSVVCGERDNCNYIRKAIYEGAEFIEFINTSTCTKTIIKITEDIKQIFELIHPGTTSVVAYKSKPRLTTAKTTFLQAMTKANSLVSYGAKDVKIHRECIKEVLLQNIEDGCYTIEWWDHEIESLHNDQGWYLNGKNWVVSYF